MPLYRIEPDGLHPVPSTTFSEERLSERGDLQRLLRSDASPLGEELFVVGDELCLWEDSQRRIDLLCLDSDGRLVVVELKRAGDGGHMELQALRYAAMVANMTFTRLADIHAQAQRIDALEAERRLRSFLREGESGERELSREVRILLVSPAFSKEITTTVLWLREYGIDVRCIRLQPLKLDGRVLIDVEPIIPPPEAADYEVTLRDKRTEEAQDESAKQQRFRRFWAGFIEKSKAATRIYSGRNPVPNAWLGGPLGRPGFRIYVTLNQARSIVECYIEFGPDGGAKALNAFKILEAQKTEIEAAFGEPLEWRELPERQGCKILSTEADGWRLPEERWSDLQMRLIEKVGRLEKALARPVLSMTSL